MKYTMRTVAAAAALLVTTAAAEAQSTGELTFCVDVDNFPMSEATGPSGFEVDLARALAERLGRQARFEWLDPHNDFTEKAVLDGRCDAALGAIVEPGGMTGAQPINGIALTEPYYSAGYLLIRGPATTPVGALEALRGTRIALEGESLVTYTLRQQGHQVYVLRDYEAVVDAVADGRAEYGYLWGPLAASLTYDRNDVILAEDFQPSELWSFAMAVPEAKNYLRQALNRGIREMVEGGSLDAIFSKYRVPYIAPARRPPANES